MIILGVDPGVTGGLALLACTQLRTEAHVKLLDAILMPVTRQYTTKPTLDWGALLRWMRTYWPDIGVIENVHAMPAQGVSSSFQFGRVFGGAEMIIQERCTTVVYAEPRIWKKHFGIIKHNKGVSTVIATELYGDEFWPLKKHEGVAEAALIATWGYNVYENRILK